MDVGFLKFGANADTESMGPKGPWVPKGQWIHKSRPQETERRFNFGVVVAPWCPT